MLSTTAISLLFKALLDLASTVGPWPGFPQGNILGSPDGALLPLVFVGGWLFMPFHTLIYQGGARQSPKPQLGLANTISNIDPTPLFPFGHGVSYAALAWEDCTVDVHEVPVDGTFEFELTVRNTGEMAGSEVVQLYLHDPYAQTTRPWARLVGYAKVSLDPGEAKRVRFTGSAALAALADLAAFTGREGTRIIEPGDIELWLATAASPDAVRHRGVAGCRPPPRAARAHRRDPRAQPLRLRLRL